MKKIFSKPKNFVEKSYKLFYRWYHHPAACINGTISLFVFGYALWAHSWTWFFVSIGFDALGQLWQWLAER